MKTFTKTCESVTMLKASQKTLILRLLKEFNEFFPKTRTKDNGDDNVSRWEYQAILLSNSCMRNSQKFYSWVFARQFSPV